MTDAPDARGGFSLKRWSRRKLEAARADAGRTPATPVVAVPSPAPEASSAEAPMPVPERTAREVAASLPPIDSLTPDSDFTPFLQPKVEEAVRRAALKKLFADPHFNVMDGLDIYIDDYTKPDPLPAEWLARLRATQLLRDAPADAVDAESAKADPGAGADVTGRLADPQRADLGKEPERAAVDVPPVPAGEPAQSPAAAADLDALADAPQRKVVP
jgi:hypothetical protein